MLTEHPPNKPRRPIRSLLWGLSVLLLVGSLLISYLTGAFILVVFLPLLLFPLLWPRDKDD